MGSFVKKVRSFSRRCPLTYHLAVLKCRFVREMQDLRGHFSFAREHREDPLPYLVYEHNSLIRRKLGNVDLQLQENKAVNLSISAPKVNGIVIKPGETFSFWKLVGDCTRRKGYLEGLTISGNAPGRGIGGGMCQFTNLIHWLVLHTPLTVTEHHHHDRFDLFPDFGRVVPFGTGTSIFYNYLDYRVRNDTPDTWQLIVYTTEEYLHGEIRCDHFQENKYHIQTEGEYFSREADGNIYRNGEVYRNCVRKKDGITLSRELVRTNHAKVMYEYTGEIRDSEVTGDNAEM